MISRISECIAERIVSFVERKWGLPTEAQIEQMHRDMEAFERSLHRIGDALLFGAFWMFVGAGVTLFVMAEKCGVPL